MPYCSFKSYSFIHFNRSSCCLPWPATCVARPESPPPPHQAHTIHRDNEAFQAVLRTPLIFSFLEPVCYRNHIRFLVLSQLSTKGFKACVFTSIISFCSVISPSQTNSGKNVGSTLKQFCWVVFDIAKPEISLNQNFESELWLFRGFGSCVKNIVAYSGCVDTFF